MDLHLKNKFFVVSGAGSGFGRAIAELLLAEGANVLAIARTKDVLDAFKQNHSLQLQTLVGDITLEQTQNEVIAICQKEKPNGFVINAGGPPAKPFLETELNEWDEAYRTLVRWKVAFTQKIVPLLRENNYGRILYIESVSVKQPVENLVLSNSLRLAVVGFVKSLAKDLAGENITLNVLAPGYHNTAAMKRLFQKKAEITGMSIETAQKEFEKSIPVGKMGEASEFASLAIWLLSTHSRFVTGQTISHDGGLINGIFG